MSAAKNLEVPQQLPEHPSDGLYGYLSTWFDTDPKYLYGSSYYVTAWPLLRQPLLNYQVGLPSTWLVPNNEAFEKPLCPKGTVGRTWPERGPTWSSVFQTMEGGLGNWAGLQFPTSAAKYQMGGTGNCYTQTVTQVGWGSIGYPEPLPAPKMGIAQFSNRIIMPPDGLTFAPNTDGQQIGVAYMPLPLRPKQTSPQPTGDYSWTFFLNAANFSGPVAFYIPIFWSRLSQNYKTIAGRGLDALPAVMNTMAMEIAMVPYFESNDSAGNTYSRIPALHFPVDAQGFTRLAHDIQFYSIDAFYNPIKNALANDKPIPAQFGIGPGLSMKAIGSNDQPEFSQGPKQTPIKGLSNIFEVKSIMKNGFYTFGLQWKKGYKRGKFPEYFEVKDQSVMPIPANKVPLSTKLHSQVFEPAQIGQGYLPPKNINQNPYWNRWVKNEPPKQAYLNDGSIVKYRWYRFVDQPAIKGLGLNNRQANRLQNAVTALHRNWVDQNNFMPPPPSGELATLDPAVLVSPPVGLEFGYVPIVLEHIPAGSSKTLTALYDAKTSTIEMQTEIQTQPTQIQKLR